MAIASKPRGRPRTFDEERVIDALMQTFWTKGFAACSLDELAAAAQVSKPSLYAAFGDKHAMYLRAMQKFAGEREAALGAALAPERPLAEGLAAFLLDSLDEYVSGDQGPRGCLVLCTAATEAVEQPEVRVLLAGVLAGLDALLEQRFELARSRGEISQRADPRTLASLAAAALHSLAIRARAREPRGDLERFIAGAARTFANS